MMKVTKLCLCMAVVLSLSACGTLNGAGQDLEAAGRAVQDVVN